jgi:AraC family transcriptional regulator
VDTGRDRLRELLDAVLDEDHTTLAEMADGAFVSPFHFSRQLRRGAGESPVAMRRRVMLERAAWQVRRGSSVTDAAFAAGYASVEGFARAYARAFGHPPSGTPAVGDHRLPAPNGIHFHPPTSLWVDARERAMDPATNPVTELMLGHDLDDTRALLDLAAGLPDDDLRREHQPADTVLSWDGPEASLAAVLHHLVRAKEVWLAAIEGADTPAAADHGEDDAAALLTRHEAVAPRWRATWRDVGRRGAWDDVLVDALCDPPESFVLSSVLAHVLTYAAHRRQRARTLLRLAGHDVDEGDPIRYLRRRDSR